MLEAAFDMDRDMDLTFYRVGLGQLSTVGQKLLWDLVPSFSFFHAKVDVCTGEVVHVELAEVGKNIILKARIFLYPTEKITISGHGTIEIKNEENWAKYAPDILFQAIFDQLLVFKPVSR